MRHRLLFFYLLLLSFIMQPEISLSHVHVTRVSHSEYRLTIPPQDREMMRELSALPGITEEEYQTLFISGVSAGIGNGTAVELKIISESFEPAPASLVRELRRLISTDQINIPQGIRADEVYTYRGSNYVRITFDRIRIDNEGKLLVRGETEIEIIILQTVDVDLMHSELRDSPHDPFWHLNYTALNKILVDTDGIVELTYEDIVSINPSFTGTDTSFLRIIMNGDYIPHTFQLNAEGKFGTGSSLFFPAERAYKDRFILEPDEYQQNRVYWLAISPDTFTIPIRNLPDIPDIEYTIARGKVRWENRSIFHPGNGPSQFTFQSDEGPGKEYFSDRPGDFGRGWYSGRLRRNQQINMEFSIPGFTPATNDKVFITVHVQSSTAPQEPFDTPDHHLQYELNGTLIDEIQFNGYEKKIHTIEADATLLLTSQNRLRIMSVNTGKSVNEVLIDYAVIDYPKLLTANDGQIEFFMSGDNKLASFHIEGFSSDDIIGYRYNKQTNEWIRLHSITVTGTDAQFRATVPDSLAGDQLYLLTEVNAALSPAEHYRREIDNLSSRVNGADYIILTHDELSPAAHNLAQYRTNTNRVRSRVVLVEDVFDTFAYGNRTPYAIREFFRYAYFNWRDTPPGYALLFGKANRDSRDYLNTGKENKLPAFGNPVSDVWYTIFDEIHPRLPQIALGRAPAANPGEAQRFVSNIIEYETYQPNLWNKQIMLMSGGQTVAEIEAFPAYMEQLANDHVLPAPYGGIPLRIYKTTGGIGMEHTEETRRALESGAVWISFFGHAAATTWDNGINEPFQLRNQQGRMHILTDLSCNTARFAEPDTRSFAERFVFDIHDPAIGFIAHTGLGWTSYLQTIGREIFGTVLRDTTRFLGDALQDVRTGLQTRFGNTIINRLMIHQYSLIGDPLLRIAMLDQPDLAVEYGDLTIAPGEISETDTTIDVRATIRNYGLVPPDTVFVELRNYYDGTRISTELVERPYVYSIDTLSFSWNPSGMPGEHVLELIVDPDNRIDEYDLRNNKTSLNTFVFAYETFNIRPLRSSIVAPDSVEFIVTIPPQVERGALLQIEIDKHPDFNSSVVIEKSLDRTGAIRQWRAGFEDQAVYHWRSRIVSGNRVSPWAQQYFYTDTSASPQPVWMQDYRTFSETLNTASNITFGNDGASLIKDEKTRHVLVRSSGFDDQNFSSVLLDGIEVVAQIARRGMNTARISHLTGEVLEVKNFDTWESADDAEALREYIDSIIEGEYLVVAAMDEASRQLTDALRDAFRTLGAAKIDSLGNRDAYALIGRKGAEPGSVPEKYVPRFQGTATVEDSIRYIPTGGFISSPWIGPGIGWSGIDIAFTTHDRVNELPVTIRTIGAAGDTLSFNTNPGNVTSVIDSLQRYSSRYIQFHLQLFSDRDAGFDPVLHRWTVEYIPPPELTFSDGKLFAEPDTLWEGEPVTVTGYVENIGYSRADSVQVVLRNIRGQNTLESIIIPGVQVNEKQKFEFKPGTQGRAENLSFQIEIDPDGSIPEFTTIDNILMTPPVYVARDTTTPNLLITIDGIEIWDGDYISAFPEILVTMLDRGPMVEDTTAINVFLNGARIPYRENLLTFIPGRNEITAQVVFTPELEDGHHLLEVFAVDAFGNPADSTAGRLSFRVSTEPMIRDVYNYPNPFNRNTHFTFNLAGSSTPHDVTIKIYTVAGRLVQEITVPGPMLQFGFNRIPWDGRDRDGDILANGVYFYTIVLRDGDTSVSAVQRLVIMR